MWAGRGGLDGQERPALVVLGPRGSTPLLGATSLELFNLAADPVNSRLIRIPGLLKQGERCGGSCD